MDRLTERDNGTAMVKGCGSNCKYGFEHCRKEDWENCKTIDDVIDKLAEYEDLEEQGLLLWLPCKVGDTVYELDVFLERNPPIIEMEVEDIILRDDDVYFSLVDLCDENYTNSVLSTDFGKTVFLTQEEAEQKLKENVENILH